MSKPASVRSNRVPLKVCVTAGPHEGGTIEAPDGHIIKPGEKYTLCFNPCTLQKFIISPDDCHTLCDVKVDDFSVKGSENLIRIGDKAIYVFDNIRCNATITADFCPKGAYTIHAADGPKGKISPIGDVKVLCGDDQKFTITPDPNQYVVNIVVDGNLIPMNDPNLAWEGTPGGLGVVAKYTFKNVHEDHWIKADKGGPVDVFLKYVIPLKDCWDTKEIWVQRFDQIQPALDFVDDMYIGESDAEFNITGKRSDFEYGDWQMTAEDTWTDNGPIGDDLWITNVTFCENEQFKIIVNLNDGTQEEIFVTIDDANDLLVAANVVDVVDVLGIDSGAHPGYCNEFLLTGMNSTSGKEYSNVPGFYGDFGYLTLPVHSFTDGKSLGEQLKVFVDVNPDVAEVYFVTYIGDDATKDNKATLVIRPDGTPVWAPFAPKNVVDIQDVVNPEELDLYAWNLTTVKPIDGDLIGAIVRVQDGTYKETIEIDTPGVVVESANGPAVTIIDAYGLEPEVSEPFDETASAVLITSGAVTFEGFTVKNAGKNRGGFPDIDHNGLIDANGITVIPTSCKCVGCEDGVTLPPSIINPGMGWPFERPCRHGRVNILNNSIYDNEAEGILAIDCSILVEGNDVYRNRFDGFSGRQLHCGAEVIDPTSFTHGLFATTEILDNKFHDNGGAGLLNWVYDGQFTQEPKLSGQPMLWTESGVEIVSTVTCCKQAEPEEVIVDPYIVGNEITNNAHAGINLLENATDFARYTIEKNKILNNGIFGISTHASDPDDIDVRYNDIVGNRFWGIKNWHVPLEDDDVLIAKENFWGTLGGPSMGPAPVKHEGDQRSEALGNGDAVSHYIHYNPWLTRNFKTVLDKQIRYYGSDTLTLQKGWNTLSVPLKLDDGANTISEWMLLGKFITDENAEVVYQFEPGVGFVDIGAGGQTIIPGRGYYIKMKQASKIPVIYSGQLGLPSFDVVHGWNLIGAPWGIDRDSLSSTGEGRFAVADPDSGVLPFPADREAIRTVFNASESIKDGLSGRGVAIIVSPSVPGQIQPYSMAMPTGVWSILEVRERMYTGEGYWAYMVNPSTYAGFEVTPLNLPAV